MGTETRGQREQEQETSAWMLAHQALSRLARERAAADAEEGRWLLEALRSAAHVHLGFGSFSEYVERSLEVSTPPYMPLPSGRSTPTVAPLVLTAFSVDDRLGLT